MTSKQDGFVIQLCVMWGLSGRSLFVLNLVGGLIRAGRKPAQPPPPGPVRQSHHRESLHSLQPLHFRNSSHSFSTIPTAFSLSGAWGVVHFPQPRKPSIYKAFHGSYCHSSTLYNVSLVQFAQNFYNYSQNNYFTKSCNTTTKKWLNHAVLGLSAFVSSTAVIVHIDGNL